MKNFWVSFLTVPVTMMKKTNLIKKEITEKSFLAELMSVIRKYVINLYWQSWENSNNTHNKKTHSGQQVSYSSGQKGVLPPPFSTAPLLCWPEWQSYHYQLFISISVLLYFYTSTSCALPNSEWPKSMWFLWLRWHMYSTVKNYSHSSSKI